MIKYKSTSRGILKDGHTMFADDIVKELNRGAHLEEVIKPKEGNNTLINELAELLSNRSSSRADLDKYTARYLIESGYRKVV